MSKIQTNFRHADNLKQHLTRWLVGGQNKKSRDKCVTNGGSKRKTLGARTTLKKYDKQNFRYADCLRHFDATVRWRTKQTTLINVRDKRRK